MPRSSNLSVSDKILIAALRLEEAKPTFTAEDLVVAAWLSYPDTFGLRGFTDDSGGALYPDSNRVFAEIMGTKPVRARGYLEKLGVKTYQLTAAGRQRAKGLASRSGTTLQRATWDRRQVDEFRRLRNSRAAEKFGTGRSDDLTFYDACAFWGVSPRSSANDLSARLAHVARLIEDADELTAGGPAVLEHGSVPMQAADVAMLRDLNRQLQSRFEAELEKLRRRTDER